MKPEDKRYILENINKKSIEEISRELDLKERKIRKFLKSHKEKREEVGSLQQIRPRKRWTVLASVVLIIILGFSVYINSLNGEFVWDDGSLITKNTYIRDFSNLSDMFIRNIRAGAARSGSFYRPLQIFTYAIDYSLWRLDARGYHLTNILLHTLTALCIFWLINILYGDNLLSLFASILFVVHPLHTEAVAYISGRADSLVSVFMLLAFILYIKYYQRKNIFVSILMMASYILALLSRESSLILPALLLLYHYSLKKKLHLKGFLPIAGIAFIYVLLRATFLKYTLPPFAYCPTTVFQRIPGFFVAITNYARVLLFPFHLHMEYGDKVFYFTNPKALAGILILFSLLAYGFRKRGSSSLIFFSIYWFFILLIPQANIFPINAYMAEHWLYLPSVGFFLILAWALSYIYKRKNLRILSVVLLTGLLVFYSYRTIKQNNYWRESIPFYERTLRYAPDSAIVCNNLGELYHHAGREEEARSLFIKAVENDPYYVGAYSNLASSYKKAGEREKAIALYKKAMEISPEAEYVYYNLGLIYKDMGREKEAISLFKKVIELNPQYSRGYNGLGVAYFAFGKIKESIPMFKRSIELNPGYGEAHRNLGVTYFHVGMKKQAIDALKKGIEADPNYTDTYKDLAVIYLNEGEYSLAIKYFDMGTKHGLNNPLLAESLKPHRKR